MSTAPSDSELVDRVRCGDRDAYGFLVRRYQQVVFDFLSMLAPFRNDLEDVVQDAFIDAFRYLHSFDARKPFKPWLLAIARNRMRKNRFVQLHSFENLNAREPGIARTHGFDQRVVDRLAGGDLARHVNRLPPHLREVVALHYIGELSQREVAEALSIPVGTVKSRLAKALKTLRKAMETSPGEGEGSREIRQS